MGRRRDEPIHLEGKWYGYLPGTFVWRGRRCQVYEVERCWTVARGSGARRVERRYFRVRCDLGRLDLYHDLLANTWGVSIAASRRAPLPHPQPSGSAIG